MPIKNSTKSKPSVNVDGNVEGNVNLAGRDIVNQNTTNNYYQVIQDEGLTTQKRLTVPQYLLQTNLIGRDDKLLELQKLVTTQLKPNKSPITIVHGMGGVGKSVLVAALCQDETVQKKYPDGIVWVTVGHVRRNPSDLQNKIEAIGLALGDSQKFYSVSIDEAKSRLQSILTSRAVLIVLDDVWNTDHLRAFLFNSPNSHILVTTRKSNLGVSFRAQELLIGELAENAAIEVLKDWAGHVDNEFPEISGRLGYLPLALKLAGISLRNLSGNQWLENYRQRISNLKLDYNSSNPQDNLEACFDLSTEQLPQSDQLLYYSLGIFPEDQWIPHHVVERLWNSSGKHQKYEIDDLVLALYDLKLIELHEDQSISLHDLLHDYNRGKLKLGKNLVQTQSKFLSSYNPEQKPWQEVEDDGYIYSYLPHHLIEAGQKDKLISFLLGSPVWIIDKLLSPHPSLEGLLLTAFEIYHEDNSTSAKEFLNQWFYVTKNAGKTAERVKSLVLQCACQHNYIDLLAVALRASDVYTKNSGLKYSYYLNKRRPDLGISLFRDLGKDTQKLGVIPNTQNIQTLFALLALFLMDRSSEETFQTQDTYRLFNEFVRVIQRITFTNNSVGKILAGQWAIPTIARVWAQFMLSQVKDLSNSSSEFLLSQNNFTEWSLFFALSPDERQVTLDILPFVNRSYGDINDLEPLLLDANKLEYAITDQVKSWIVPARGLREPHRALELTQKLFNCDTGNGMRRQDAAYLSYNFLIRQRTINDDWLSVYRTFMKRTIDEG
jgi:hypothetical protein